MSYRTYIALIDKKKLNKLRKCNSMEDVKNVFDLYGWKYYSDDEDYINCPIYNIEYLAEHEFGADYFCDKYYEDFDKAKKRIFKNKEVDENYQEYNFEYGGIDLIEFAIKDYKERIHQWFENLASPNKSRHNYEIVGKTEEELKELHYQKMLMEVKNKASEWSGEWGILPYNENKDDDCCVRSWLYEYQIFDLVRLYKMFDPKKHYVVFYGW